MNHSKVLVLFKNNPSPRPCHKSRRCSKFPNETIQVTKIHQTFVHLLSSNFEHLSVKSRFSAGISPTFNSFREKGWECHLSGKFCLQTNVRKISETVQRTKEEATKWRGCARIGESGRANAGNQQRVRPLVDIETPRNSWNYVPADLHRTEISGQETRTAGVTDLVTGNAR